MAQNFGSDRKRNGEISIFLSTIKMALTAFFIQQKMRNKRILNDGKNIPERA
jgi:hypothetical protein